MLISYNIKNGNITKDEFDSNVISIDIPFYLNMEKKIFSGCAQIEEGLYKNDKKFTQFEYTPTVLEREIYDSQAVFKANELVKNRAITKIAKQYDIVSFKDNPEMFTIHDVLNECMTQYLNDSDFDCATQELISSIDNIEGEFDILGKSFISMRPGGNCKMKFKLEKRIKEFIILSNNSFLDIQVNEIEYPKKLNKIVLDEADKELTLIINNKTENIQTLNYLFILFNEFEEVL